MVTFTAGAAAKRLGLSKPTISKYIGQGKIAAEKLPDGSFSIDGAELARFEASYRKPTRGKVQGESPKDTRPAPDHALLAQVELAAARDRISELEADKKTLQERLIATEQRLDKAFNQLTGLMEAQIAAGSRPWWQRLIGSNDNN